MNYSFLCILYAVEQKFKVSFGSGRFNLQAEKMLLVSRFRIFRSMICYCVAGFVFRACGLGCPQTCDNYKSLRENPNSCDLSQVDGCFCPDDQVRDSLLKTIC
jgi:hypothetical protein